MLRGIATKAGQVASAAVGVAGAVSAATSVSRGGTDKFSLTMEFCAVAVGFLAHRHLSIKDAVRAARSNLIPEFVSVVERVMDERFSLGISKIVEAAEDIVDRKLRAHEERCGETKAPWDGRDRRKKAGDEDEG
jgi:hypothetical protein